METRTRDLPACSIVLQLLHYRVPQFRSLGFEIQWYSFRTMVKICKGVRAQRPTESLRFVSGILPSQLHPGYILYIAGSLGHWTSFVVRYSGNLGNATFRQLVLFPSSDEGELLCCNPLEKPDLNPLSKRPNRVAAPCSEYGNRSSSRNFCLLLLQNFIRYTKS
jgi:hypothetical protein